MFRQDIWKATHLRTFKYKLWKNIKKEDLKDQNGDYFKMTWDLAIMLPMLEMSGNRFAMIEDVLYVYNRENPLNDFKVDRSLQVSLEKHIRQKKKYGRIF